jgi:hypothetical protein
MKFSGCIFGVPMIVLALVLVFFGVLFLWAAFSDEAQAQGKSSGRLLVGGATTLVGLLLLAGAGVWTYRSYKRYQGEKPRTVVQQIDLPGDLSLEELKCRACGAALSKDNIDVKAGAVVVTCPYCGTSYEVEEEPKW